MTSSGTVSTFVRNLSWGPPYEFLRVFLVSFLFLKLQNIIIQNLTFGAQVCMCVGMCACVHVCMCMCVSQSGLECGILLSLALKCWVCRYEPPCLAKLSILNTGKRGSVVRRTCTWLICHHQNIFCLSRLNLCAQ